ncbi:filamentous hemagglutinin N-terminal domain-containing protein [Myxosarcina sp. GI1]|uniref:two-partner secretion domain-containing protein n=1 Tax=Myxosarcina sp. GI1 TaxID=1541065 RepID=UPI00056848B0|nr:filamentous hemagglutinin N-terminal domain-containing protein [Myxosarcina sp. GI1]
MVRNWRILLVDTLTIGTALIYPAGQILAQNITTDGTLGTSQTIIGPNYDIPQSLGQTVKNNLFHSFGKFNLNSNEAAIFQSGNDINNIFSRVTGGSASSINGLIRTLGQDVNLFLLNPNGIIFGPNASLNVSGSFLATTADSLVFGNGLDFSATNPEEAPLLTINFTPGLQYGQNYSSKTITNQGNLAAGQNLELTAGNLDLQGQLQTGRDLILQADNIQIRDSLTNPFIAAAGNKLLIQGNESIDIFALNNPRSGLFSGGDMTLISTNSVVGDVHFWSGGNFQIKQSDSSLGNLHSLYNPVIRASGDVSFDSYTGASLHIFAGGSVTISGDINIASADTLENSIRERVTLSDSGTIFDLDGSAEPTLDIRAGTTAFGRLKIISNINNSIDIPDPEAEGTTADVNIEGAISVFDSTDGGRVFITNQYQPNLSLDSPNGIRLSFIDARDDFGGGSVTIDSRSDITLDRSILVSAFSESDFGPFSGNAGDVTLLADGNIIINPQADIVALGLHGGNISLNSKNTISVTDSFLLSVSFDDTALEQKSGDINLIADHLSITNLSRLATGTLGKLNAGNINLTSESTYINQSLLSSQVLGSSGNAGNITVNTNSLMVDSGGQLTSLVATNATGNGGNVEVIAKSVEVINDSSIAAQVNPEGRGNAGNLNIEAERLRLAAGGQISSGTFGEGDAGDLNISVNQVEVIGGSANTSSTIFSSTEAEASGSGGSLTIETDRLLVNDGAQISTATANDRNAGNLKITAREIEVTGADSDDIPSRLVSASEIASENAEPQSGSGGNLTIETNRLFVADGGQITSATVTKGNAGRLLIKAESIEVTGRTPNNIFSSTIGTNTGNAFLSASGNGEKLSVKTDRLIIADGAQVISSTFGSGKVGEINVRAKSVEVIGSGTSPNGELPSRLIAQVEDGATGNSGNLIIDAESLFVADGGQVAVSTFGQGNAGNLEIITQNIELVGLLSNGKLGSALRADVNSEATGNGGNLKINTESLRIRDGGQISADTLGDGKAGNITITSNSLEALNNGKISTATLGSFNAGNITMNVRDSISLAGEDSGIFANTEADSTGNSGSIFINPQTITISDGAAIAVNSDGSGQGGSIALAAEELTLNNSSITAETTSNQGGNITLNGDIVQFIDDGEITATAGTAQAEGNGGNVNIDADFILAFPTDNTYGITANAFKGDGGNIELETISFFGSDFVNTSASSQFGLEGDVSIEILELDPARGLIRLPADVIDASQQISQACTPQEEETDRFVAIGRGGLPLSPNEPLRETAVVTDWVDEPTEITTDKINERLVESSTDESSSKIVEAQGWVVNDRGNVELVSEASTNSTMPINNPCNK